jgi:hypothetical protein
LNALASRLSEYAEPKLVTERERFKARACFFPELPDPEITYSSDNVMKQHDAAWTNLWIPRLEVVADRFVSVHPVNVKQVDARFPKLRSSLIEHHSQQVRLILIMLVRMLENLLINLFTIGTGVFVALPRIDCKTLARDIVFDHRLAETEKGDAAIGSQLDYRGRADGSHQVISKWDMVLPRTERAVFRSIPIHRRRQKNGTHAALIPTLEKS